jgi:predicted nucleic acid-binding protein
LGFKAKKKDKEVSRLIICDTGPLLHLSEARAIHLLSLAGDILVPPVVVTEFEANTLGWKLPQWIKVTELEKKHRVRIFH